MILTVTPNPALDLTYHLDSFVVGASHRVPPASRRAGGKGVNVARVLHGRGVPTRVLAPVGGSPGETFRTDLADAGIPHDLLPVGAATRSTTAVVTPETTTNLNETGAALTAAEWDALVAVTAAAVRASAAGVLVVSGSLPPDAPADAIPRLVAAARAAGVPCVVDTSGPQLLAAADAGAEVLKPNRDELLAVVGGTDVVAAAMTLAGRSGGTVYASLGAEGLLRVWSGTVLRARLDRTLAGNTTGAGDAAVAAIATCLLDGSDAEATLRRATAWSAAAVLHPLAGSIVDPEPLLDAVTLTPDPEV